MPWTVKFWSSTTPVVTWNNSGALVAGQDSRRARLWQSRGIGAVPAVVIDGKYLISGGQPPEAFEKALRSIAAEAA